MVEHSASTNVKRTMQSTKCWSVGNRNKSITGRFKILNGFEFIYIAI